MHDESRRNFLELIAIGVFLSAFVAGAIYTIQSQEKPILELDASL